MALSLYLSTDAGAPVITGQAGSILTALTAILVNGYGSRAAAGWTKPYTGTNKAVFKAGSGNQGCLWIDDSGLGAGGLKESRLFGYEAMTALDTGTGQFPTASQSSVGIVLRKSATADGVARPWVCVADGNCFQLWIVTGDHAGNRSLGTFFGDIVSYKTGGDAYSMALIGRAVENAVTETNERLSYVGTAINQAAMTGHYLARGYTGLGTAQNVGKFLDGSKSPTLTSNTMGTGSVLAYPNAVDGGLYVSPVWVCQNSILRGHVPYLWAPMHSAPLTHLDTYNGTGSLAGKKFMAVDTANGGQVHLEIPAS